MSASNQARIKQIRKKNNNNSYISIPIGTDGLLVDMLSNLDLEEELKIGNNHYVEIQESIDSNTNAEVTTIIEYYYDKDKDDINSQILYTVKTIITSNSNGDIINCTLYKGDITAQPQLQLHTKQITINQNNSTTTIDEEVI